MQDNKITVTSDHTLHEAMVWRYFATFIGQAVNLKGFRTSMNPRFDGGIPDFVKNSVNFNVIHRKVHWLNPQLKSLNSIPVGYLTLS